jgi:hypothetical protein
MEATNGTEQTAVDAEEWQRVVSRLAAGAKDDEGETITLVYRVTDTFAIYLTKNGVKHLSRHPIGTCFALILGPATELNHYREEFRFVDQAVAQAKAACLDGIPEQAREVLLQAHRRVLRLLTGAGRLRYVLVCMIASALVVTAVSVLSYFAVSQEQLFVAWMAACGSIGAFLSVSLNLRSLQIDPAAPRAMTTISAVSRVVIGMIGAGFILLVVRGNLVLGLLADLNNPEALLAIGVLAGFSETFVPNVLRRVETQADVTDDKTPSNKPLQPTSGGKSQAA